MCPQKVNLLSVNFDTETAKIRWLIVTYFIGHYVATIIVATCL